jgi:hypothetical protein
VPVTGDAGPRVPWSNGPVTSDAGVPGVRYVDVFANQGGNHTQPHVVQGRQTNYHCFVFTVPPHPTGATEEFAFEFTPFLDQRRHIHHIEVYRQDPDNPIDPVGNNAPRSGTSIRGGTAKIAARVSSSSRTTCPGSRCRSGSRATWATASSRVIG